MLRFSKALVLSAMVLGFALGARAGPAMFSASFIIHAWGNDITSGTAPPSSASLFTAVPLGHDCQYATPYKGTPTHPKSYRYCPQSVVQAGAPATGPRPGGPSLISTGTPGVGGAVALPQSAFGITTTGFLPTYYPYLQSNTYATFVNGSGSFFAGGGPGSVVKTGMGQQAGTWIINRGPNTFGGAMGLLGKYGSVGKYVVPGVAGTYSGYGTWNVIVAMGRCFECTPVSFTAMGKASNWLNPFEKTQQYTNDLNGKTSAWLARGTGTLWTTGSVTLYATAGIYTTILHRAGFDTVTGSGARNIQLVTPTLTHWIGIGFQSHTGQMGILNLRVPEPGALLLLAAGAGVLGLLYRMSRRR